LWPQVETPLGQFSGKVVVNAAGAWADEVAALARARPVGLVPKRRTAILFQPPAGTRIETWPTVIDADEEFYFRSDAGKIMASPAPTSIRPTT
jgi:D-arginine dehydrogenase